MTLNGTLTEHQRTDKQHTVRSHINKGRREHNVRDHVNVGHEIANNLCDRQLAPTKRDVGLRLSFEKGYRMGMDSPFLD